MTITAPAPEGQQQAAPARDRVALVTGGVGAAISHQLAADGAEIAAGYWCHSESAEKVLAEMTAAYPGRRITLVHPTIRRCGTGWTRSAR